MNKRGIQNKAQRTKNKVQEEELNKRRRKKYYIKEE